jgi:protein phosphatase
MVMTSTAPRGPKAKGMSDKGLVRETNQDSLLIDEEKALFIVADGMGGHAGGEIASQLCIKSIKEFIGQNQTALQCGTLTTEKRAQILQILSSAVNHASAKIYEHALEEPSLKGMGTTTTLVHVIGNYACCAHVGDSRLYLCRNGFIYQMSVDHSLVNEQVRAGLLSESEAHLHHLKNVITRSVGYQEEEEVDIFSFELAAGDYLVLCSDGLHGKVEDTEISLCVKNLELNAVEHLVNLANERGGEDNITIIVVKI